jgi:GntR family transcriptional regulator
MPDRPVDRSSDVPLWHQLQQDLARRLAAGDFVDAFPGELALVEEYQVSRHTVRQALRQLRADGVIIAERGRQPRVAAPPEIAQPVGALYSLFASVEAAGITQHSTVRTLAIRADGVVSPRLGLEGSTPLLYLERLRFAGNEPLALDRVWMPAALAAPLLGADFTHTGLYKELADRAGIRPQQCRRVFDPPPRPGTGPPGRMAAHAGPRRPVRPDRRVLRQGRIPLCCTERCFARLRLSFASFRGFARLRTCVDRARPGA